MSAQEELLLFHEVLLLALEDESGRLQASSRVVYALGGALLAELLLRGRVTVVEPRPKRRLVEPVAAGADAGARGLEPPLDECLQRMRRARRRAAPQTWVTRFAALRQLRERVAQGLCRRGILRADEDRVLGLFRRRLYPAVDPAPERELIGRLRRAIFEDSGPIAPRTAVLVSLARSAGLLELVFEKPALRARKAHLERLVRGELAGAATREAIDAMQMMVLVAALMPTLLAAGR